MHRIECGARECETGEVRSPLCHKLVYISILRDYGQTWTGLWHFLGWLAGTLIKDDLMGLDAIAIFY